VSERPTLDYATPPKRPPSYAAEKLTAVVVTVAMLVLFMWALGWFR
jgi:hypothetical protein